MVRPGEPGLDPDAAHDLMGVALEEARAAVEHGDVPIGAVVARATDAAIVARRHNERERRADPTAHAELLAIQDAARALGTSHLNGLVLVTTLEPCPMCAGAAVLARIEAVVFATPDPRAGALGSLYHLGADPRLNHEFAVYDGVRADEAAAMLRDFFAGLRAGGAQTVTP